MGQRGDGGNIGDFHDRIGGGLDEDQARVRAQRALHLLQPAGVRVAEAESEIFEYPLEQPEAPAIQAAPRDDVVARLQQAHHGVDGRHSGSKGEGKAASFERRQVTFQRRSRRVRGAGVFVTLVLAQLFLNEG